MRKHKLAQDEERRLVGSVWQEGDWAFCRPTGRPIDPRADHDEWKSLLSDARVRDARLHDARHTAATMLLVLKVPLPAIMEVMGWGEASVAKRYVHVPTEVVLGIAKQMESLLWAQPPRAGLNEPQELQLTSEQRQALVALLTAMVPANEGT
ncbi:tyrosine-type recombinase/integrase [Actinocrispum sp. NPDC049592]|uniref:tyrosine-type recombinase/integrase n=1 Tax=Actinocrispum sp. NPDC049592 TaxID=3154835 RepID=UPI00341D84C4